MKVKMVKGIQCSLLNILLVNNMQLQIVSKKKKKSN